MNRREVMLQVLSAIAVGAPLSGCAGPVGPGPVAPKGTAIIDMHCHLFNGSDLPIIRFIKIVILEHYPKQGVRQTFDIDDEDFLDGLVELFAFIVGATKAPTCDDEIKVLKGAVASPQSVQEAQNDAAVISAVADFTSTRTAVEGVPVSPGAHKVRRAILVAGEEGSLEVLGGAPTKVDPKDRASKAFHSDFDVGVLLRWFGLFTRYRFALADKLAADHAKQNLTPLLFCPALIDYDNWLGEYEKVSSLPKQVEVMGYIARRPTGPAVHGYVGFDPLRQVMYDEKIHTDFDPLGLVSEAIDKHGFLGAKLYPPMGFKAIDNAADPCQVYPVSKVFDALVAHAADDPSTKGCVPRPRDGSRDLSRKLDGAMTRLFDLCSQKGASLLAHANDSNGSNKGFSHRADPSFWLPVFTRWKSLHVCLAHFGHFASKAAAAPAGSPMPDASWEWVLGNHFKANPASPVFADVSYLSEIFEQATPDSMVAYTAVMRRWIDEFDPELQHLTFGTDWIMLGLNRAYPVYSGTVYQFFKEQVKLNEKQMDRLFKSNAARFLGIRPGDPGRQRLDTFYEAHGLPKSRLPAFS
jgi:predicted TIM-barrel fold metal-dependent hydrolase